MSGDPEQEYFGEGIAEDIITALTLITRHRPQFGPTLGTHGVKLTAAAGLAGHFDVAAEALVQIKRLQSNISLDWIEKYHPIVHAYDRAMYMEGLRQAGLD